jgi:hypothetical protein
MRMIGILDGIMAIPPGPAAPRIFDSHSRELKNVRTNAADSLAIRAPPSHSVWEKPPKPG